MDSADMTCGGVLGLTSTFYRPFSQKKGEAHLAMNLSPTVAVVPLQVVSTSISPAFQFTRHYWRDIHTCEYTL